MTPWADRRFYFASGFYNQENGCFGRTSLGNMYMNFLPWKMIVFNSHLIPVRLYFQFLFLGNRGQNQSCHQNHKQDNTFFHNGSLWHFNF